MFTFRIGHNDIALVRMQNVVVSNAECEHLLRERERETKGLAREKEQCQSLTRTNECEMRKAEHKLLIVNHIDIEEETHCSENETDEECESDTDDDQQLEKTKNKKPICWEMQVD